MKNMFESSEAFTAYATIDAGYFMLRELNSSIPVRSEIEKSIDKATGYDKVLSKEIAGKMHTILSDIIDAKKLVDEDFKKDKILLDQCVKIIKE